MTETQLKLIQFNFSHFNEKLRWALDFKGLPHTRQSLMPGPHVAVVKPLTGETQVPVLVVSREGEDDLVMNETSKVINWLEETYPDPALYPADPNLRTEALALQARFDETVGPFIRLCIFYAMFQDGPYARAVFTNGQPFLTALGYKAIFPIGKMLVRSAYDLTPERNEEGIRIVSAALDEVAEKSSKTGYLVGDQFSIADLTAASLLMLTGFPDEIQFDMPEAKSKVMKDWFARWDGHPGQVWVRKIWKENRPQSAELSS